MRLYLAVFIVIFAGPALALPLHPTARAVITQSITGAIRPGFAAHAAETARLVESAKNDCGV